VAGSLTFATQGPTVHLERVVRVERAPVPNRARSSTWPCHSCGEFFELATGWRVVHRLGGVERIAYVCEACATSIRRSEQERQR
jgi:phage terminase large subunit GpA-like protein